MCTRSVFCQNVYIYLNFTWSPHWSASRPVRFFFRKRPSLSAGQDTGRASEPVCTHWQVEKCLSLTSSISTIRWPSSPSTSIFTTVTRLPNSLLIGPHSSLFFPVLYFVRCYFIFPPLLFHANLFHSIVFYLFFISCIFFPSSFISFWFACLPCYFFVYRLCYYFIHYLLLPCRLSSFVSVLLLPSFLHLALCLWSSLKLRLLHPPRLIHALRHVCLYEMKQCDFRKIWTFTWNILWMLINRFQRLEVTVLFHMLYIFQFLAYIWLFCKYFNCSSRSLFFYAERSVANFGILTHSLPAVWDSPLSL